MSVQVGSLNDNIHPSIHPSVMMLWFHHLGLIVMHCRWVDIPPVQLSLAYEGASQNSQNIVSELVSWLLTICLAFTKHACTENFVRLTWKWKLLCYGYFYGFHFSLKVNGFSCKIPSTKLCFKQRYLKQFSMIFYCSRISFLGQPSGQIIIYPKQIFFRCFISGFSFVLFLGLSKK